MAKENAVLDKKEQLNEDLTESFDFDELEEKLQSQLEEELADMQFLADEKEKIGSPDNLGNVIMDVVWEQFVNQVAVTAGEDFIKENRGLHLDLRKEAHIQTTENFAEGKIATHNTEIDYQQRYDDWQSNFVKDENGNVVTHQTRSGKEEATLVKGVRKPYDDERKKRGLVGNAEKGTDMDETVSVAKIIRDPSANAHMTQEERIEFDLSEKNLNEMCQSNDYVLDDEAKEKIHLYFEQQITSKDENFANGRLARNLYDDLVMNHARRVVKVDNPSSVDLSTIKAKDFNFECSEVGDN